MSLVGWGLVAFSLEDVAQMTSAVAADNLCSLHAKGAVCVAGDGAWDGIEVGRPAAATLKFVFCLVERGVAASAGIDACVGLMLVIFAREWGLGALFSQDTELFLVKYGLPFLVGSLIWVRHLF